MTISEEPTMKWIAGILVTLAVIGLVLLSARPLANGLAEKARLMELHPKGAVTPVNFGAASYQDLTFDSDGRRLDARLSCERRRIAPRPPRS